MKSFLITTFFLFNINLILAQIVIENSDTLNNIIYDLLDFPEDNSSGIRSIDSVSIIDSNITTILDDILKKEKMCNYFSNSLCLSMRISPIIDKQEIENKESYFIKFELCELNTAVSLDPIGFFVFKNIKVFIFDNVLLENNLYIKSVYKKNYNYDTKIRLKFDNYSQYFLYYINGIVFFEEIYKCK